MLIGAASTDITPDYPIRLSGYGGRRAPSDGTAQHLFAKALAIGSAEGGNLTLIITLDNLGIPAPMAERIHQRIAAQVKLPREQFAICASHTHTAPMLSGLISNLFGMDIPNQEWQVIDRYTAETTSKIVDLGLKAIHSARPCELYWGIGQAGFAKNRRTERGPVDHEAPILAARADGKWVAVLVNYACHCTTLEGGFNKLCGDWAGYAQEYLEEKFPGITALVAIGCGGDANPNPRGVLTQAQDHGRELAHEVERLLNSNLKPLSVPPKGSLTRFNLAFHNLPTRAQWEELAKKTDAVGYHARKNLARLDRGEKLPAELPYLLQVMAFSDDLAMVFMPGEVVVDYSLRIKRTYSAHRVWVNAYSHDDPCYIPSKRILDEGGYEGGGAMVYYDQPTRLADDTEERIFSHLETLMPAAFKVAATKEEKPTPKSASEALKTFRLKPGFEIDLVASEPLVIDPVAIDFAADGRLWVVEMHDYPSGMDGKFKPGGRIKVLSSTKQDGHFDHADMLVDDVPFPTGIMAWKKGALVCAAPDILYIEDTDGDGKADVRKTLYSGFATHNYQARVNGLRWGLDGWVYGAAGLFGGTIHSHLTGRDVKLSGRDFRIKPDTGEFEAVGGLSQQGRVRDDFGNWFGCDNGMWMWHFPLPDHYLARNQAIAYPDSRVAVAAGPNPNEVYPASITLERFNDPDNANHTTSACGIEVYRDFKLGRSYYQNAFTPEPVHNLVHRLVVEPDGTTFKGMRAQDEQRSEFVASTDNWFRPVETRTGPDGALWIVDMYRYVIEHPRWISSNRLAQLDVRAGDQQGRIYRVRNLNDNTPPTWSDLTKFSDAELIKTLANDNGVLRDLAHRLLIERGPKEVAAITALASAGKTRTARLQSLYLQDQIHALDDSTLRHALRDKTPAVRATAIKLSERRPSLGGDLATLISDADPAVRLQLAFSLGEFATAETAAVLGTMAMTNLDDPRMRYAILSSATRFPAPILQAVLQVAPDAPGRREMVDGLIRTAGASRDANVRGTVLSLVLPKENESFDAWRLDAANTLLEENTTSLSKELSARLQQVRVQARAVAIDSKVDLRLRQVALEILARLPLAEKDLDIFGQFLNQSTSPALQMAALNGLRKSFDTRAADAMLANWSLKSPSLRTAIVDELLQRDRWTERLLTAVESSTVNPREIGPMPRQRLLHHSNKQLADRARKLFQETNPNRAALVAAYGKVSELAGNPNVGLALFAENCAMCHAFHGIGHPVGPDLVTYHDKPASDFVLAILHPNAAVEPRFINYQVETKDGRLLSGVLSGETAASITILGPNGAKDTLLRLEINSLQASGFSLMPEGFEVSLNHQGMADLIAYLRLGPAAPFGSAIESGRGTSREEFLRHSENPVGVIQFASEVLDYASPFGVAPLNVCRQSDGKGRVEWKSAHHSSHSEARGRERFDFPVAFGLKSQPQGGFTLSINGKRAFDLDVCLDDKVFGDFGGILATYCVLERNEEDSSGILSVLIPAEQIASMADVRFSVNANGANSQRWFGLYSLGPVTKLKSADTR